MARNNRRLSMSQKDEEWIPQIKGVAKYLRIYARSARVPKSDLPAVASPPDLVAVRDMLFQRIIRAHADGVSKDNILRAIESSGLPSGESWWNAAFRYGLDAQAAAAQRRAELRYPIELRKWNDRIQNIRIARIRQEAIQRLEGEIRELENWREDFIRDREQAIVELDPALDRTQQRQAKGEIHKRTSLQVDTITESIRRKNSEIRAHRAVIDQPLPPKPEPPSHPASLASGVAADVPAVPVIAVGGL